MPSSKTLSFHSLLLSQRNRPSSILLYSDDNRCNQTESGYLIFVLFFLLWHYSTGIVPKCLDVIARVHRVHQTAERATIVC